MTVSLTPRQRAAIFARLTSTADWGGGEAALAARIMAWDQLRLAEFDGAKVVLSALPVTVDEFMISDAAADHLLQTLCNAMMHAGLAMDIAAVMRALRAA